MRLDANLALPHRDERLGQIALAEIRIEFLRALRGGPGFIGEIRPLRVPETVGRGQVHRFDQRGMRQGEPRIEFNRGMQVLERFRHPVRITAFQGLAAGSQEGVVGRDTVRRRSCDTLDLRGRQLYADRCRDGVRDLVLHTEEFIDRSAESRGPKALTGRTIHEVGFEPQQSARAPQGSLQQYRRTELGGDFMNVEITAAELKGGR